MYIIFKKILLTISVTANFAFKIGNSRIIENIFSAKINHELRKSNHFLTIGKKRY